MVLIQILPGILTALCIVAYLHKALGIKKHDAEPPFIPTSVPYFGHLLGLLSQQIAYYAKLSAKYGYKIYSLAMPGGRIYIVNSPSIISEIQKHPTVLSFWFIEASLTKNLGGISNHANEILLENARGDKGQHSLVVDGMKATHKAMSGQSLDRMTLAAIQRAKKELDRLSDRPTELDLWDWVQRLFSLAVSNSVYGPDNPYEDRKLERGLSEFADHTVTFLTGLPPWLFIPKAYAARESIVASFENYFAVKSDEKGSELVQARARVLREYGIPEADIARFEAVNGFGILLNLLPTAFWTAYHIFSDPKLLDDVRKEAEMYLPPDNGSLPYGTDHVAQLDRMTILTSTLKESLRFHASGAAARMVMQDHLLSNQWLLKKDSYIFIPNRSAHFDQEAWGDNADEFNAYRFDRQRGEKIHAAAFRGFGGGANLCPGRVFSTRLIVAVVASLVLRFDVKPLSASGKWEDPGHDESSMAIVLARPKRRTRVEIVSRGS